MNAAAVRRALLPAAALLALGGGSVAHAVPPGGAVDNPKGAAVTIAPNAVATGGKVVFTGTGFVPGEQVSVKIDDGLIESSSGSPADVFAVLSGAADGTLSGTIDLARVAAKTPVAPGSHSLRLLSSEPVRSLHGDFTVVASVDPAPGPGTAPGAGTTAPGTGEPGAGAPAPGTTPAVAGTTRIAGSALTVRGSRSSIKVTGTDDVAYGTVRIRSRDQVRLGGSKAKQRLLFAPVKYAVAADQSLRLTLRLTSDGRAIMKKRRTIKVVVEATETTGGVVSRTLTVRR